MSPKRIDFFIENYIPGGVERYYGDLISGLPKDQFDVRLFANPISGLEDRLKSLIRRPFEWVPYRVLTNTRLDYELYKSNRSGGSSTPVLLGKLITRIPVAASCQIGVFRLLGKYPGDVLHIINGGYPGAEACRGAAMVAKRAGFRRVILSILSYPYPRRMPWDAWVDRRVMSAVDDISPNSAFAGKGMVTLRGFSENIVHPVLSGTPPPAYDPEAGCRLRTRLNLPERSLLVGTVAALEPMKGHLVLLEAVRELGDEFPDAHFIFSGDGIMRPQLEQYIAHYDLAGRVHLLGYDKDARLLNNAFDLIAFPSFYEGLPFAILEAMALGKPIVATSVGGIPEQIDNGISGLLVPPRDSHALADGLRQLIRMPHRAEQMGTAAREKYYRQFTPQQMVNAFLPLYAEATS